MEIEFNFWEAIQSAKYSELIPTRSDILPIVKLYQAYQDEIFEEKHIIQAIQSVNPNVNLSTCDAINLRLQKYFLIRNTHRQNYCLSQYAKDFCWLVQQRLRNDFDASELEKLIGLLFSTLEKEIQKEDLSNFLSWKENIFDKNKLEAIRQLESLDRKVKDIANELSNQLKNVNVSTIVENIDNQLDVVRKQIELLNNVLKKADNIRALVSQLRNREDAFNYTNEIVQIQRFVDKDMRERVGNIEEQMDKIPIQIRYFFNFMVRPDFDRNTERFIKLLLTNSKSTNKAGISFPDGIDCNEIPISITKPKFLILKKDALVIPKKRIKSESHTTGEEDQNGRIAQAERRDLVKNSIKLWVERISDDLIKDKTIHFQDYFNEIVKKDGIKVAIRVSAKLLKKYSENHEIQIQHNLHQYNRYGVWQMKIQQREKEKN